MSSNNMRRIIGKYLVYEQLFTFWRPNERIICKLYDDLNLQQVIEMMIYFPHIIVRKIYLVDLTDEMMNCFRGILRNVTHLKLAGSFTKLVLPLNVKSVVLHDCPYVNDISACVSARHLAHVELRCCVPIDCLVECVGLQSVILGTMNKKIPSFKKCNRLRKIVFDWCRELVDVGGLPRCIKDVRIRYCSALKNLDFLRGCSEVRKFESVGNWKLVDFGGLMNCNHLESLVIERSNKGCENFRWLRLERLRKIVMDEMYVGHLMNAKRIKYLELIKCVVDVEGRDLSGIRYCKLVRCVGWRNVWNFRGVRELELCECNVIDLDGVVNLVDLESISIIRCFNLVRVDELGKLERLKYVKMENVSVVNLDSFRGLKRIEMVTLWDCGKLVSIDGLVDALEMKYIVIGDCVKLENIDVLNVFCKLEKVEIENCGVRSMFVMNRLEYLVIRKCEMLQKLNVLNDVGHLGIYECNPNISFCEVELKYFVLRQCNIKKLDGFCKVKKMRWILLDCCGGLEIRGINEGLELIRIHNCDLIGNLCNKICGNLRCIDVDLKYVDFKQLAKQQPRLKEIKLMGKYVDRIDALDVFDAIVLSEMKELEVITLSFLIVKNINCLGKLKKLRKINFGEKCEVNKSDVECLRKKVCVSLWVL